MATQIGVLALQGDFAAHQEALSQTHADSIQVRKPEELENVDGLIIPGGESSTLIKLMEAYGFIEPIRKFVASGKSIFGTCAGSILVARVVEGAHPQFSFGFIDLTVERNGYGRQVHSFEADVPVKDWSEPIHAVFIRAPRVVATGENVDVLGRHRDDPVIVRAGRILITTFHPELTGDSRVHDYFVTSVTEGK